MEKAVVNKNIKEFTSRFKKKNFSIEKLHDIETDKLTEFNMRVYKNEFNTPGFKDKEKIVKFWKWKYNDNPASKNIENFGWVATYKNNLIGQFHIIPTNIKIGDENYRGTWGSDLAILKEYRNIGVSAFLIQEARKEAGKDFALFLLGGMNENSYGIFEKSGFINVGRIPRYVKILDLRTILNCYGLPSFLSSAVQNFLTVISKILYFKKRTADRTINVEIVDDFNEEFEKFWSYVSAHYKCIARRDLPFLRWRYINQPLWAYAILRVKKDNNMKGFAILRTGEIKDGRLKGKKIGIVSDILIDPGDRESANKLLIAAADFFKDRKTLLIKCDILNNHIEKILKKCDFIKIKSQNAFMLNVYEGRISKRDMAMALVRKNWFISSGDSDFDYY